MAVEQQGIIRHGFHGITTGKNVTAVPAQRPQFLQQRKCLTREWHQMGASHLHACFGNSPERGGHVELIPRCVNQLAGAYKGCCKQLQTDPRLLFASIRAIASNCLQQSWQLTLWQTWHVAPFLLR